MKCKKCKQERFIIECQLVTEYHDATIKQEHELDSNNNLKYLNYFCTYLTGEQISKNQKYSNKRWFIKLNSEFTDDSIKFDGKNIYNNDKNISNYLKFPQHFQENYE